MSTGSPHITVQFDLYDASAIPAVLRGRIDDVERHLRLRAETLTPDERAMSRHFIQQLERCILAVEEQLPSRSAAA